MSFWASIKNQSGIIIPILGIIIFVIISWKIIRETYFAPLEANVEVFDAPVNPDIVAILELLANVKEGELRSAFNDILGKSNIVQLNESDLKDLRDDMAKNPPKSIADSMARLAEAMKRKQSIADELLKAVQEKIPVPSYHVLLPLEIPRTITHLKIKPGVVSVCHNVKVHIPEAHIFQVSKNGLKPEILKVDLEVPIGDLQSGDNVEVYSWGGGFALAPGQINVTSDQGSAALHVPQGNWFLLNSGWFYGALLIGFLIALVLKIMRLTLIVSKEK